MILNRLSLFNFGLYRGRHEFDLRPQPERPLIIVGGQNGAGKTTLLEAIRLCLYGPLALDRPTRPGRAEYEAYLAGRIHQAPQTVIPIDLAQVELEFSYTSGGEGRTYAVKREWRRRNQGVREDLRVFEDGQPLADMDARQWDDFLRELLPPGLSRLFFFDGEKIQALAQDGPNNPTLTGAIKSLLGLNIVEQLQTDLGIYRRRLSKKQDTTSTDQAITKTETQLDELEREKQALTDREAALAAERAALAEKIGLQEQEIARAGGGFAREREQHRADEARLLAEIDGLEQALRELCAGLLPFAITPQYTNRLTEQLLREEKHQQWLAAKGFIEARLDDIQAEMAEDAFWAGSGAEIFFQIRENVSQRVGDILERLVEPPEEIAETPLRHQLSPPEQRQLLHWLEESRTTVPARLQELTGKLTEKKDALRQAQQALARVPDDDVLRPLMVRLNDLHQQLGALQKQAEQLAAEQGRLERAEADANRHLERLQQRQAQEQALSQRIHRVIDVEKALTDFSSALVASRVEALQAAFTRNFNRLCRKESLIARSELDPHDFSLTLIDPQERILSKADLSAGEKQIYAIAMLWALRQVSGRPLPVIIDTPLGRLDSSHRRNLIDHYFPRAGHQVILFSTDTEVDAAYFRRLGPAVTRAYHLVFDQAARATRVEQGYFWEDVERRAA